MSTTIESLELEIQSNSKSAVSGIDALTQSLTKLKSVASGKLGLSAVVNEIASVNKANVSGVKTKIDTLKDALSSLTNLPKTTLSGYINPLKSLPKAFEGLQKLDAGAFTSNLEELVTSLEPLQNLSKSNLSGYLTSLKQIPDVMEKLNNVDMGAFATKMQEVATAMKPLADEMQKVSNGFSAMPTKIQKLIQETEKVPKVNKKASLSFTDIFHAGKMVINTFKRVGSAIYSAVEKSMDYTENMNLFRVSMGEYASSAYEYAEKVEATLGIDPSAWIRAQGVFMTMATGFGVAGDRAAIMSQNLTQLGYDLASFYNLDEDDALTKLKSGLAGELEPLRAIGYDLSQAKLEATALELGITKSVTAMTQAEKAQLRYYAIMTQVTIAQGDMARTLDDPANQMRVFKSQLSMTAREIGNIFIPALNAILPVAIAVTKVIGTLAKSIAGLFGYKDEGVEESSEKTKNNISGITKNLQESQEEAKKLKSYMLGFDELNVINPNTDTGEDASGWKDFELPTYDFFKDAVESRVNDIVEDMKEWLGITEEIDTWADFFQTKLGKILLIVGGIGGAFTLWKIGTGASAIMTSLPTFAEMLGKFKTVLLGFAKGFAVGAIIAGAVAGAAYLISLTDDTITKIGGVLSAGLLAIGGILAFTGNIPLGIAFMAMGAMSLGTAIALNTDGVPKIVKDVIAVITGVVSVAMLALGALIAFSGANVPLGIGLLLGGALTLGTAIAPKWDSLSGIVKGIITTIMMIVGGALLALGAILAFSGVAIPLGIGFMLTGAASLGGAVALNWNFFKDNIGAIVGSIAQILAGASLVLGVMLCLSGAGVGLGLALIGEGLATTFAAWKLSDNPITNFVKKMVNGILGLINKVASAITDLFHIKFDGLKIGGASVIPPFSIRMITLPNIPLLAEGGFPDQGQMFIAREAGAEMVGNIGRRTAVVNNDQIVASISGGVAEANAEQNAILREQNTLLRALLEKESGVYIDGKHLTASVEKYQRERGRVLITGGVI